MRKRDREREREIPGISEEALSGGVRHATSG